MTNFIIIPVISFVQKIILFQDQRYNFYVGLLYIMFCYII